jgi:glycogen synthase
VSLFESTYKLEWMDEPWDDVARASEWLLEIERTYRAHVVHLNGYVHGQLPFVAPVMTVAHSCVLSWWQAVKGEAAPPPSWDRYRREVTAGLRGADMIVAPSNAMLATIQKHYGLMDAKTRVIYNARDPERYDPTKDKAELIFAAGRAWDEAKNTIALDRAARRVPWRIGIAGDACHPNGKRAFARNITMLGRLSEEEMSVWLASAAIYALPARYEPFGLSILEAALSRCALVLGDIPSLREIWDDAAIYVSPDDHAALRKTLLRLIREPGEREQLARRALERAQRYAPHRMADAYYLAYRSLCARAAHVARPSTRATDFHFNEGLRA